MAGLPWPCSLALACLSLASFLLVFSSGLELVRFTSLSALFRNISGDQRGDEAIVEWRGVLRDPRVLRPLGVNTGLILLFVLQHSLMANETVKRWTARGVGVLQRSLYVACTALSLQVLIRYWQPLRDGPYLWNACTEPWNTWLPLLCFALHFLAWLVIFSIVLVFDYAELMGIKQVYYHCLGLGDPLALKSQRAVRLYSHLRHPVYLEFLLILWAVPCLPLDRLLLAGLLTLYLTCGHGLDQQDYHYLRAQLDKKSLVFTREEQSRGPFLLRNGASGDDTGKDD